MGNHNWTLSYFHVKLSLRSQELWLRERSVEGQEWHLHLEVTLREIPCDWGPGVYVWQHAVRLGIRMGRVITGQIWPGCRNSLWCPAWVHMVNERRMWESLPALSLLVNSGSRNNRIQIATQRSKINIARKHWCTRSYDQHKCLKYSQNNLVKLLA